MRAIKNYYEIRGETTVIFITQKNGQKHEILIDSEDFGIVAPIKWHITNIGYIQGKIKDSEGKYKNIKIHTLLMNTPKGMVVDHVNHNKKDNRRSNLRILTQAENLQNREGAEIRSKTGIRGVSWSKVGKKWIAQMKLNKKNIHLGYFENIEDAENAVIEARKQYMPFSNN